MIGFQKLGSSHRSNYGPFWAQSALLNKCRLHIQHQMIGQHLATILFSSDVGCFSFTAMPRLLSVWQQSRDNNRIYSQEIQQR